jgi:pimeloyl-ACP methyl ester carboxylesterase
MVSGFTRLALGGLFCAVLGLSAAADTLKPPVVELPAESSPGLSAELVTVRKAEIDLVGRMVRAPESSHRIAIVLHDTLGSYDDPLVRTLQNTFAKRGISSVAINLSLNQTRRIAPLDCGVEHAHRHEDALDEIRLWLDWLTAQGWGPAILSGVGRGGAQIAWYLAKEYESRVAAAILLGPNGLTPAQADADYRARYEAGLAALLTRLAKLPPDAVVPDTPFLNCGAVAATKASIVSYYGVQPMRDTPTALADIKTPTLALTPGLTRDAPNSTTVERLEALKNPLVIVRTIEDADAQFSFKAGDEMAEAIDAYLRSMFPTP